MKIAFYSRLYNLRKITCVEGEKVVSVWCSMRKTDHRAETCRSWANFCSTKVSSSKKPNSKNRSPSKSSYIRSKPRSSTRHRSFRTSVPFIDTWSPLNGPEQEEDAAKVTYRGRSFQAHCPTRVTFPLQPSPIISIFNRKSHFTLVYIHKYMRN